MFIHRRPLGLVLSVLALFATACEEKKAPVVENAPATTVDEAAPPAASEPAPEAKVASHPECVGPRSDAPAATFEAGGKSFERKGSTLTMTTADADDELVIGQLSDIKDFTPENKANIDVALKWFEQEKVDVIALTGDLGESQANIELVLRHVAAKGLPVLAIAGNRECRDHFKKALDAVSGELKNVINMNEVRVFNTDDASVVSMPGYYNRSYIHCADGCEYTPDDVAALESFAQDATAAARVLIAHAPPKQNGEKGIDRIHEEVNVGDPKLAEVLGKGLFPFGLFGNIQEAGGYATDLAGTNRVEQGQYVDALYLNPGPIDSVRWQMLDGSESLGMAGLLKVKGKQASYKVYRIKPGAAQVAK
ncbi:MAG: metallophosphoesterase family protein [Myxococcota bacterium]